MSKKSGKGELVAIYRLEFYKNQKKWKFCKNERKLKQQVLSKQKLNETYRVDDDDPPEVEPPAPLNDAFLDTDSDENLKQPVKPSPPARRRWSTILDLKIEPDRDLEDWALPDEKPVVRSCWEPSVEQLKSYEQEWGEEGGWDAAGWGEVEQVYSSEFVSNEQRRLPVFAGWPATDQHTAEPEHDILQGQKTPRQNVAETLRQQIENLGQNVGQMGQNVGRMGQNVGQMGQNVGRMGQNDGQMGQNVGRVGQNLMHMNQSGGRNIYQNTQLGQNYKANVSQNLGYVYEQSLKRNIQDNIGHFERNDLNIGQSGKQMGRNALQLGQSVKKGQSYITQNVQFGQNVKNLGQNMGYLGQNGGHIMDDMEPPVVEKAMEFSQMDWEVERDVCVLEDECGGECVAAATAAVAEAEGWLHGHMAHFYLPAAGDDSLSSGDSASFVRGAHARAHSSELDLTAEPCQCANISANKLAHMSTLALRDALRAYTAAAQRLLFELRLRAANTHSQPPPVSPDVTRSSLPTRDGPGSLLAGELAGRGRGRRLLTK